MDIVENKDLFEVKTRNLLEISNFLQDKKLHKVSENMKQMGIGLSYPVLKGLCDGKETDYTNLTLKKISYYIEHY